VVLAFTMTGLTAPTPAQAASSDISTIYAQTNAARVANGLPALKRNAAMDAVAQAWAKKMAAAGAVTEEPSHNPFYSTQIPKGWTTASENVAMGYTSTNVVAGWLNSPGHRKNIMAAVTDIGIGYYVDSEDVAWSVQNFAKYPTVKAAVATPKLVTAPTQKISGTTKVGQTLTAVTGTWSPTPVTLSYQWKRGGAVISGAIAKTYKLTASDIGKTITVSVTGKKSGYTTVTKTTSATAPISGTLTASTIAKPSGTTKVGSTLTANTGTWGPGSVALSYQWKRAGTAIPGATGRTYKLTALDAERAITVTVTGKRTNYTTTSQTSAGTAKVTGLAYANCTALTKAYPHGVAKAGIKSDIVSKKPRALKGPPFFSSAVYALNTKSDGDKDGIACEG
jgi:hypothetical protein